CEPSNREPLFKALNNKPFEFAKSTPGGKPMANDDTPAIIEAEKKDKCPECGSSHLERDYQRGELVCADCGLVIDEEYIDQGPEWRAFDAEQGQKRARTGAPMTYTIHDKGLST